MSAFEELSTTIYINTSARTVCKVQVHVHRYVHYKETYKLNYIEFVVVVFNFLGTLSISCTITL